MYVTYCCMTKTCAAIFATQEPPCAAFLATQEPPPPQPLPPPPLSLQNIL